MKEAIPIRRRTVMIAGTLALILGFLLGSICPQEYLPWGMEDVDGPVLTAPPIVMVPSDEDSAQSQAQTSVSDAESAPEQNEKNEQEVVFNPKDNFPLLNTACAVLRTLQTRNYAMLASYVHPERGLTFTPYSTVSLENDLTFTMGQVKKFAEDQEKYVWGVLPGTGDLIQMTPGEFVDSYIFGADYTQASRIGVDRINISGNALENVTEVYPDCRFVDYTFPGFDPEAGGLDWCSLKLIFAPAENQWRLVGLIHSQWTV